MSVQSHVGEGSIAQARRALLRAEESAQVDVVGLSLISIGYALLAVADALARAAETVRHG